jgi:hypothetical protein
VSGATIAWSASATNALQFSACGGASSCSVLSDEAGESSTWVTPTVTGPSTITIALAPASYSSPQTQQATVLGTSSTLDLVALTPTRWVGQGATLAVPLTVEALDLGAPKANVAVSFKITNGAASLSAGSGTTNGSGFATITASLTNQNADVQVSACIAPNNVPCQTFTLFSTPASLWRLETVSGSSQVVPTGQAFQPLVMRVTDGSSAANPVMGVNVTFETTLARVPENGLPVILGSSQAQVVSTEDGLASIVPSAGSVGPCEVFIAVSAGRSSSQFQMENVVGIVTGQPKNSGAKAPTTRRGLQFNWQNSTPLGAPQVLFAVPEGFSSNEPAADSHTTACSDSSADDACDRGAASPSSAGNETPVSPKSAKSKPAEAKVPKKPAVRVEKDRVPPIAASSVQPPANPVSSSKPPEDKRSCRVLAEDGILF